MGQTNSKRISHGTHALLHTFRDDQLEKIIDDLVEEIEARGFQETFRDANTFVEKITLWDSPSKLKKMAEIIATKEPTPPGSPFVQSVAKSIFSEDGLSVIATVTTTVTRDGNKRILSVNTAITRP